MRWSWRAPKTWAVAAALLAAVAVVLLVAQLRGHDLFTDRTAGLGTLAALALAAALALTGWARDRRRLAALDAERGRHEAALDDLQRRHDDEAGRLRRRLDAEQAAHARAERSRKAERAWSAELRGQVARLQQERGVLHDPDDVRALVLHTAVTLVEAERGLLLSRRDGDGDGRLDLVCAEGFEEDEPEARDYVQRLGRRVLQRDEMVREDGAIAVPVYIQDEFEGIVVCAGREGGFDELDDEVLLALGDHAGAALGNSRLRGDLRTAYLATVRALAEAIEAKDRSVRTHSEEVSRCVEAVARRMELEPGRREQLLFASLLHDVGKIGISERILLKPGRLTGEEFAVVKQHPRIGHRLVSAIPALAPVAPAVLHHHERYDGGGYPDGLAGERIPLEARIIAVADSFSAMTAARSYTSARTVDGACDELERCAGTQFDPEVVRLFVEEVRRLPPAQAGASVLDGPDLAAHRDGSGPLGAPAAALVDGLTLLYARPYAHEHLEAQVLRATVQGGSFAVILVELADLEAINRLDGFAAGDRALVSVAEGLRRAEQRTAGVACRLSGRRFALVVGAAGDEASLEAAGMTVAGELSDSTGCRLSGALWRPGEDAQDLLARARAGLAAVRTPS